MNDATQFIETYTDCPWMVTAFDYAKACNQALHDNDYSGLEKLSSFGRKHGPFLDRLSDAVTSKKTTYEPR